VASEAILFDLDGTIWDSYPWYASALTERLEAKEGIASLMSGNSIVRLLRQYRVSDNELLRSCEKLQLFPTVAETLEMLTNRDVILGAVTNLPGRLALPMLAAVGLASKFEAVIHAGNCRSLKPHPKPILQGMSELGVSNSAAVLYVGDSAADATSASRAGVWFAWAAYGYSSKCPQQVKFVLEKLRDLLTLQNCCDD
jgi:HAD superfamily hydrolase (TIGR01549 family)